jgi:hypothetical protein
LRTTDIIWKDQFVEKLSSKDDVSITEVGEVPSSNPVARKVAKGRVRGEDV